MIEACEPPRRAAVKPQSRKWDSGEIGASGWAYAAASGRRIVLTRPDPRDVGRVLAEVLGAMTWRKARPLIAVTDFSNPKIKRKRSLFPSIHNTESTRDIQDAPFQQAADILRHGELADESTAQGRNLHCVLIQNVKAVSMLAKRPCSLICEELTIQIGQGACNVLARLRHVRDVALGSVQK